ncbi:hypothetical protein DFH09DRAFT_1310506 [Mycena vulgaris]|nr:hypothetical protein DFH09DRAFT_1310506 [Mycena vulgaris]
MQHRPGAGPQLPSIRQLHPYLPPTPTPGYPPPSESAASDLDVERDVQDQEQEQEQGNHEPPKKKRRRQALSCTGAMQEEEDPAKCQWHVVEPASTEKYVSRAEHEALGARVDALEALLARVPPGSLPPYVPGLASASASGGGDGAYSTPGFTSASPVHPFAPGPSASPVQLFPPPLHLHPTPGNSSYAGFQHHQQQQQTEQTHGGGGQQQTRRRVSPPGAGSGGSAESSAQRRDSVHSVHSHSPAQSTHSLGREQSHATQTTIAPAQTQMQTQMQPSQTQMQTQRRDSPPDYQQQTRTQTRDSPPGASLLGSDGRQHQHHRPESTQSHSHSPAQSTHSLGRNSAYLPALGGQTQMQTQTTIAPSQLEMQTQQQTRRRDSPPGASFSPQSFQQPAIRRRASLHGPAHSPAQSTHPHSPVRPAHSLPREHLYGQTTVAQSQTQSEQAQMQTHQTQTQGRRRPSGLGPCLSPTHLLHSPTQSTHGLPRRTSFSPQQPQHAFGAFPSSSSASSGSVGGGGGGTPSATFLGGGGLGGGAGSGRGTGGGAGSGSFASFASSPRTSFSASAFSASTASLPGSVFFSSLSDASDASITPGPSFPPFRDQDHERARIQHAVSPASLHHTTSSPSLSMHHSAEVTVMPPMHAPPPPMHAGALARIVALKDDDHGTPSTIPPGADIQPLGMPGGRASARRPRALAAASGDGHGGAGGGHDQDGGESASSQQRRASAEEHHPRHHPYARAQDRRRASTGTADPSPSEMSAHPGRAEEDAAQQARVSSGFEPGELPAFPSPPPSHGSTSAPYGYLASQNEDGAGEWRWRGVGGRGGG